MPSTLKEIGYQSFGDCTSLTTIDLPESLTIIGDSAFGGCENLKTTVGEGWVYLLENGTAGTTVVEADTLLKNIPGYGIKKVAS